MSKRKKKDSRNPFEKLGKRKIQARRVETTPRPEFLDGNEWEIRDVHEDQAAGVAGVAKAAHKMVVPLADSDKARAIQFHEMGHVKWSPANIPEYASGLDQSSLNAIEDARVNMLLTERVPGFAEVSADLRIGDADQESIVNSLLVGDVRSAAGMACASLASGRSLDYEAAMSTAILELENQYADAKAELIRVRNEAQVVFEERVNSVMEAGAPDAHIAAEREAAGRAHSAALEDVRLATTIAIERKNALPAMVRDFRGKVQQALAEDPSFLTTAVLAQALDDLPSRWRPPSEEGEDKPPGGDDWAEMVEKSAGALDDMADDQAGNPADDMDKRIMEAAEKVGDKAEAATGKRPKGTKYAPRRLGGGGEPKWAKLTLVERPLRHRVVDRRITKKHRHTDQGMIPTAMGRFAQDGRVFRVKNKKRMGGALLLDMSGSMSLTAEQIQAIVKVAPHAKIYGYASEGSNGSLLWIVDNGRRVADSDMYVNGMQNGCDGLALDWLAEQDEPRLWISDGQVSERGDNFTERAYAYCARVVRRHRILRVEDPEAAVDVLKAIQ